MSFNPYEAVETMTAYIAQVGIGDVPTGSIEYKTIFAVGATLFVATLRHEPDQHPARAPVPGGVRVMTVGSFGFGPCRPPRPRRAGT